MANFLDTIKNYFNPLLNYSGYPTLDSKTPAPTVPEKLTPYQQSMLWQPSAPAKNPVQPIGQTVPSYVNPASRPAGATVINGVSVPQPAPVQAIGQPAVPPVSPVTTTAPTGPQASQKVIDIAKQRLRGYGMSETAPNYQKSLDEEVNSILINANMYGLGQNDLYQNPVADVQPIGGGVEPIGAGAKAETLRTQLTGSLSGIADAIKKLSEGTKGAEDYYNQAKEQFDPYYKDIIEGVKQRYSIERDRQLKDNESAMGSAKAVIFNTGIQDTPFSSTIEQKQRDENTKVLNALDARMNAEVSSIGSEFSGKIIAAAQKNLDNALAERNQKLSELQQQASLLKDIVQPILDSAESDEDKVLELAMKYPDAGIDPRFDDVQGSIAKLLDSPTYQEEVARAAEKEFIAGKKAAQVKVGSDLYEINPETGELDLVMRARKTGAGTGEEIADEGDTESRTGRRSTLEDSPNAIDQAAAAWDEAEEAGVSNSGGYDTIIQDLVGKGYISGSKTLRQLKSQFNKRVEYIRNGGEQPEAWGI